MGRVSPCHSRQPDDIAKYQFLRDTQERSEVRFYSMLQQHRQEVMPIVYTPTVGKAVQLYSDLDTAPRGITVSPRKIDHIDQIREDYSGTMPAWGAPSGRVRNVPGPVLRSFALAMASPSLARLGQKRF